MVGLSLELQKGMVNTTGELLYNLALALTDALQNRAALSEPEEATFTALAGILPGGRGLLHRRLATGGAGRVGPTDRVARIGIVIQADAAWRFTVELLRRWVAQEREHKEAYARQNETNLAQ